MYAKNRFYCLLTGEDTTVDCQCDDFYLSEEYRNAILKEREQKYGHLGRKNAKDI